MPRAGYDCTGIAEEAPGAVVSTRTRHRRPGGNATPRATTPENQPTMDVDDPNATPRASRINGQPGRGHIDAQNGFAGNAMRNRIAQDARYGLSYATTANSNNGFFHNQPPNNDFPRSIFSQNSLRQVGTPQNSFSQASFPQASFPQNNFSHTRSSNNLNATTRSGTGWNSIDLDTANSWNGPTQAPQAYALPRNNLAAQGSAFASYGRRSNMGRALSGRTAPPSQSSYPGLPTVPPATGVVDPAWDTEAMDVEFGAQTGRERGEKDKSPPF